MGAFEYTALDSLGRSRKGVIEGDTARHVRSLLRERQLLPVTIEEVAQQRAHVSCGVALDDALARSAARVERRILECAHGPPA